MEKHLVASHAISMAKSPPAPCARHAVRTTFRKRALLVHRMLIEPLIVLMRLINRHCCRRCHICCHLQSLKSSPLSVSKI